MRAACILLFGSLARGDSDDNSDTDILVADTEGPARSDRSGNIEIQYTPQAQLIDMARSVSLFAIHLAYESKVIADPSGFFSRFKYELRIKGSYQKEKGEALSLLAFLLHYNGSGRLTAFRAKRIAWCVRTVLISLLVERGRFVFSPKLLVEAYEDHSYLPLLLSLRRVASFDEDLDIYLEDCLANFLGDFDGDTFFDMNSGELLSLFGREQNAVALSTISGLEKAEKTQSYPGGSCNSVERR